jgi:CBS-domain-containing membrane protein
MNLTKRNVESQFVIRDFMIPLAETPVIQESNLTFKIILETIEKGKLGFAIVVRENNEFVGLVSNADVRKSLLNSIDDLTNLNVTSMINRDSVGIQEKATVNEMLQLIKKYAFPITYLPVLDEAKKAVGIVTFVNLIRGEI